jgi:predicted Zn-dependent protease
MLKGCMKTNNNHTILSFLIATCVVLSASCYRTPIASSQPPSQEQIVLDDSTLSVLAFRQYSFFMNNTLIVQHTVASDMMDHVGARMALAAQEYFSAIGDPELGNYFRWQFLLVDNSAINAWALPGGVIIVYSGALPYSVTEGGLAALVAHNMAHLIIGHGYLRFRQQLLRHYGPTTLLAALAFRPVDVQLMFAQSFAIGVPGVVAYSVTQEYEADDLARYLMRLGGYNPIDARIFWQNMVSQSTIRPPDYLGIHPGDQDRLARMGGTCPNGVCNTNGPAPTYMQFGNSFRRYY